LKEKFETPSGSETGQRVKKNGSGRGLFVDTQGSTEKTSQLALIGFVSVRVRDLIGGIGEKGS
jgi:hypothetical protein